MYPAAGHGETKPALTADQSLGRQTSHLPISVRIAHATQ
jgi:hypothetical protein